MLWCRTGATPAAGIAEPDQLASLVAGTRLTVVLPCLHLSFHTLTLPTRSERRIRESLPYALEEELAGELEGQHFAYQKVAGGVVHAAVIRQAVLDRYQQRIQALGLRPDQLLSENDLVAVDQTTLIVHDDYFMLSHGTTEVLCGSLARLADSMALSADSQSPYLWDLRQSDRSMPLPVKTVGQTAQTDLVQSVFSQLVATYPQATAVNLLQGEYAVAEDQVNWHYYRYAAAAALCVFVVGFAQLWMENHTLQQRGQFLTAQIEQVYRTTFPQARRVEDPRVQMQQQLQRIQSAAAARSTDFIGLLANTGEVLQRFGKGRITRLSFQQGQLRVELRTPTQQIIQRLITALEALHTVTVTVAPIRQQQQQYVTTLLLRAVKDKAT